MAAMWQQLHGVMGLWLLLAVGLALLSGVLRSARFKGWLGERLLVSPRFHRCHHGVLSAGEAGCNYAVLLPVWDWLFGTADFNRAAFPHTGDPGASVALERGGWWRQQWAGLLRLRQALAKS